MPRFTRYGHLGPMPHPYHRHWEFTYRESDISYEDFLDNTDLELCPRRNRIKIVGASVLMYVGEKATAVTVDVHLPA